MPRNTRSRSGLGRQEPNITPAARRRAVRPAELSVVVPVYNEEESVPLLHKALGEELGKLKRSYEIVFVDDGSKDGSALRLKDAQESDRHVKVVRFRRNYGQTAALQAGIEHSSGKVLVFMDSDLQNDPKDIGRMLAKLDEGYDLVSGWRADRQDNALRRIPSKLANALISWVTGVHLHDYGCTLKAYRREVLEPVRLYGEMHRFIPAYASQAGARIAEMSVTHHARQYGQSKYGIWRTLRVLLDLMTVKLLGSYGTKPIYFFGFAAFWLWVVAFGFGLWVLIAKFRPPYPEAHNNPLLLLAVFLGIVGVQFILMGLLAELVMRTYHESQGKATYAVREVWGEKSARARA